MSICKGLWVAVTVSFLFACGHTQTSVKPPAPSTFEGGLPVDENILQGKLDNGLHYLIRQNDQPENFVELRLVVKAGSIYEDDRQRGFAHFVEHMAFNGTEDFKAQEIVEFVESIGMRFGAHLNATTTFDHTIYQLRVPTDNPKTLETALQILQNWAQKVSFEEGAMADERGVVLEEWRARKGVADRIAQQQWPLMFAGTNYASRMPIGLEDIIKHGEHEDLVRFYETFYRPDLMAVIAVGDFVAPQIEALIKKYFATAPAPAKILTFPIQYLDVYSAPVFSIITDDELSGITISTSWRNRTKAGVFTEQDYKQRVVKNLLSGIISKRINDLSLDTQSPFIGAQVGFNQSIPTSEEFYFRASVKPQQTEDAFKRLLTEIKRVVIHGVTEQELRTEKRLYLEWFESALKSQNTLSHHAYLGSYINHFLLGAPITSLSQDFVLSQKFLEVISADDIQAQMAIWAEHNDAVVFVTAPSNISETLPSQTALQNIWREVQNIPITAAQDKPPVVTLMDNLPVPGAVVQKSYIDKWDAHQWVLSNGVTVIVKATDFKENSIGFRAISNGGFALVDDDTYLDVFGLMDSMNFMGLGTLNMEQLVQFSRGKRFSLIPAIQMYSESMVGASNHDDLIYMLQSVYLRFTAPVKDKERFEWLKDNYRPQLENKYNSPSAQFYAAIQEKLQTGNPRNVEFDVAMLDRQNIDTIFDVYQQRFADASDFTFVFVGDLNVADMEKYISTYIASLPTTHTREQATALPYYGLLGNYQIHIENGTEPKATVIISLFGDAAWSYENEQIMAALQSALEKALRERLREELGAVYSVGVNSQLSRWPHQHYSISVSFTCDPERVDELYNEVNQVFARFVAGDIDAQALLNYQMEVRTNRAKNLQENTFWLNHIVAHFTPFLPPSLSNYNALIEGLTLEKVKQAAKTYLLTTNRLYATLRPSPQAEQDNEKAPIKAPIKAHEPASH